MLLVAPELRLLHANRAGVRLDGMSRRGLGNPARRIDGDPLVLHVLPLASANPLPGAAIFVAPTVLPPRRRRLPPFAALFGLSFHPGFILT